MIKYEKGMSKTELLLVLMIILLPTIYFYVSEFIDVKKEKDNYVNMEKELIKRKVDEFVTKNKKELLTNSKLSYLNCSENTSRSRSGDRRELKVCELNLEVLKTSNLVSASWLPVVREYPSIPWKSTLSFEPSKDGFDIVAKVYPERTPDYTEAAFKTLNMRLMNVLNKTK